MKANPSFQFYPSDWLRDPGLRSCSLAARGLWIDLVALMHEAEPYGHLRLNGKEPTTSVVARMVGSQLKQVTRLLIELENAGVFSRTQEGTIFSRRMVRDHALRIDRAKHGHLSANNPAVPRRKENHYTEKDTLKGTNKDTLPPSMSGSPSPSSSSSSSMKNKNPSVSPLKRIGNGDKSKDWEPMPDELRPVFNRLGTKIPAM